MTKKIEQQRYNVIVRHARRSEFVAACRLNGTTAQDVLSRAIDDYLKKHPITERK